MGSSWFVITTQIFFITDDLTSGGSGNESPTPEMDSIEKRRQEFIARKMGKGKPAAAAKGYGWRLEAET